MADDMKYCLGFYKILKCVGILMSLLLRLYDM